MISRQVDNTFTFKNYQRLEVNKTINGKFYQFCHRMNVAENYMIYSTHNPKAGKDWQKRYQLLEIYSNNTDPFQNTPPGIGSGWKIRDKDNNYYWDLGSSCCVCSYSEKGCSECNTDWKETQGDKLIYYEGANGSITLNPLRLFYPATGFFKPIKAEWKEKTGTFKLKIEPKILTDDCDKISQIEFKGGEFFSDNFRKTITGIIEKGNEINIWFKRKNKWGYGYLKRRGKGGNEVAWITPTDLEGNFEDYQWLKNKDGSNIPKNEENHSENYENWTREQLINEIKHLKAEIEELKNNQVLSVSSKQIELEKKQSRLEKLEKHFNSKTQVNKNKNGFPTSLIIGGVVLAIVGLITGMVLIIRRIYSVKKKQKK